MKEVEVKTQAELEAVIKDGNIAICVGGELSLKTVGVEAPYLVVKGGASLSVEAWGSSQPRVEAWGSSQPRVVARESSQPRVEAKGMVQLSIHGAVAVVASALVAVAIHGDGAKVDGGQQTIAPRIDTPEKWCDYYGAPVDGHKAILFKGVNDEYQSPRGGDYTPGTIPQANDWDGGKLECGGGFHASPHPAMTLSYNRDATKFVACPVLLTDIAVHCPAEMPDKVKFSKCCEPCYEVNIDGERIEKPSQTLSK